MLSDHPRKVDMGFTSNVKIKALSNISSAYQPLLSKQSCESWIVLRALPRLKPLGCRYSSTYLKVDTTRIFKNEISDA
jgi:hypothetical protein